MFVGALLLSPSGETLRNEARSQRLMFCWIVARAKRMRYARAMGDHPVGELPVSALWTAEVQRAILEQVPRSQMLQSLEAKFREHQGHQVERRDSSSEHVSVSASNWQQAASDLHGKVLGYVKLQPEFVGHACRLLDDQCQQMRDFWMYTVYHTHPVLFSQVQDAEIGDEPVLVHAAGAVNFFHTTNWFFKVSPGSLQVLNAKFPAAVASSTDLALCLPTPHAFLILLKQWPRLGLPQVLQGRSSGVWNSGRALLEAIEPQVPLQAPVRQALNPDWVQDPASLLGIVRNLQQLLQPAWVAGGRLTQDTQENIRVLQSLRDSMLLDSVRMSRTMYDLTYLLQCVMLAADLKASERLPDVLLRCLRIAVPNPAVRSFYEQMLRETHRVPSSSTLLRNRLTVHLGYMRVRAMLLDKFFDQTRQAPGVVRWSTMDASPHKGFEFVLSGHSTMALQDLPTAAKHAFQLLSGEASAEITSEAVDFLCRRLELVPAVPTAVGSARAALPYKIKAVAHATRLESNSWSQVALLLNSTFSWTGDLGTESHICSWKGSLADLFGDWILHGEEEPEQEPGFQFQGLGAPEPDREAEAGVFDVVACEPAAPSHDVREAGVSLDFRPQLFVPGMLHLTHNMTRNLETALTHWDTFVGQLSHVCRLLAQPWSCRRFLRTCLDTPPWTARQPEFEAFHSVVYSGRWGTTMSALQNLVPLLDVLRKVWNIEKFGRVVASGQDAQGGEASRVMSVEVIEQALTSNLFYAYARTMAGVAEALEHMQRRCESCPCPHHPTDSAKATCPLRTRRGPELAAGSMPELLHSSFEYVSAALLAHPCMANLAEGEHQLILTDFQRARQHLVLATQIKLGFWQQLPYVLFGLGHKDAATQRQCAARALQLFDSSEAAAAGDRRLHHHVTLALCAPETAARRDLEALIAGRMTVQDSPALLVWAGKFMFTPVAERWVEALHAAAKRGSRSAPHAGPLHIAFESALPFLRQFLQREDEALKTLATACQQTRKLQKCLDCLGLRQHPTVQGMLHNNSRRVFDRQCRKMCVQIFYHCDADSHYVNLPPHVFSQRPRTVADMSWSLPPVRNSSKLDQLMCRYILLDLKNRLQQQADEQFDDLFVLLSVNNTASPFSLESFVSPNPSAAEPLRDAFQFMSLEGLGLQNSADAVLEQEVQNVMFLRVAHFNPSRCVTVSGVAQVTGREAVVVEHLPTLKFEAAAGGDRNKLALVGVLGRGSSCNALYVLDALHFPCADLLGMQLWTVEKNLRYHVPASLFRDAECAQRAQEIVDDMVKKRAFERQDEDDEVVMYRLSHPHGFFHAGDRRLEAAQELKERGFLCRTSDIASLSLAESTWQLSEQGLHQLQVAYVAHSPKAFFEPPPEATPACSTLQLLLHLEEQGWSCMIHQRGSSKPQPYKVGDAKVWWVREQEETLPFHYLLAVATAEVSPRGDVPHLRTDSFYKVFLGLQDAAEVVQRRPPRALFDFCEGQDAAPVQDVPPKPRKAKMRQPRQRRAMPAPVLDAVPEGCEPEHEGLELENVSGASDVSEETIADVGHVLASGSPASPADAARSPDGAECDHDAVGAAPASGPESSSSSSSSSDSSDSSASSSSAVESSEHEGAAERAGHSTARLGATFFWKSCRFTMLKHEGNHIGWEANCRHPDHRTGASSFCRRSLRFQRHGGEETVLRKLKWWLLQAPNYSSKAEHVNRCPWSPADLPAMAELDGAELVYAAAGDPAAEGMAKAAPKGKAKAGKAAAKRRARE